MLELQGTSPLLGYSRRRNLLVHEELPVAWGRY